MPVKGLVQTQLIQKLQTFQGFCVQKPWEKAGVTKKMAAKGYSALFGVKYHAELAPIERKWMFIKAQIRKHLDGKLGTLKGLVASAYCSYTVGAARKDARHCRDTLKAYQVLGQQQVSLFKLAEEEKKFKGHRRVIDGSDGLLKLKASIPQTAAQLAVAARTKVRRENTTLKGLYMERCSQEWESRKRRKHWANRDEVTKAKERESVASRLKKSQNGNGILSYFNKRTLKDSVATTLKLNEKQ